MPETELVRGHIRRATTELEAARNLVAAEIMACKVHVAGSDAQYNRLLALHRKVAAALSVLHADTGNSMTRDR